MNGDSEVAEMKLSRNARESQESGLLWGNSLLALPAWPLRLTEPDRVLEGELKSRCWLDGALFTEIRQAGKTGVAGSPSPLALGPVDLVSQGSAGTIWSGLWRTRNELHHPCDPQRPAWSGLVH